MLVTTPFHLNKLIAQVVDEQKKTYFDLTESVEITDFIRKNLPHGRFVSQCGLAPGMVSIIANNLASKLDKVDSVKIMVGALSVNPTNHLKYYLTWSPEGLINEYVHPCKARIDHELVDVQPLSLQEDVIHNGDHLQAATTSGGIGSLAETLQAREVIYKTLRWPGHWDYMRFLKDDLGLKDNFANYVQLFRSHVPQTVQDEVRILITATGWRDEKYLAETYEKIIPCTDHHTAIQISTGTGVMNVINLWYQDKLPNRSGLILQEELDYDLIWKGQFNYAYR